MTVFVARQPILDRSRRTCAYELLYRSGPDSGYDAPDADRATLEVIDTSFHVTLVPDDPGLAELGITPDALPVLVAEAQQEAERAA